MPGGSEMNDLFMYLEPVGGGSFPCESSLVVNKTDDLMKEFKGADYDIYSNFFDVTDFDFSMEMDDSDQHGGGGGATGGGAHGDWYLHRNPLQSFASPDKNSIYKLKKISGSFGKVVDSVSPTMFQNCCRKQAFGRAILVKRAFTGLEVTKGETQAFAFLRIDMTNVRVTGVSWTDGDLLQEKIQFKCDSMDITYKQQSNPGNLGEPVQLLHWKWLVPSS
jgi:type VI protein secretion system component Hcp